MIFRKANLLINLTLISVILFSPTLINSRTISHVNDGYKELLPDPNNKVQQMFNFATATQLKDNKNFSLRERDGTAWIAAGCLRSAATEDWMEMRSININYPHILWRASIGKMSDGTHTYDITIHETKLTETFYQPVVLGVPGVYGGITKFKDEFDIITFPNKLNPTGSLILRQVKSYETFVDVIATSKWEFELRFYKPQQVDSKIKGLYTVSGQPVTVWKIRNPIPPAINRFQIIKIVGSTQQMLNEFAYDYSTDTWTLTNEGKVISKKTTVVNPRNKCEMVETMDTLQDNGQAIKRIREFRAMPWGIVLFKTIEDADNKALITTYTYYEDPKDTRYTWIKTITHPDGTIEVKNKHK